MANDDLVKLLYYSDANPLSKSNLSDLEKQNNIFEKLIKVIPIVKKTDDKSIITISVLDGSINSSNDEFRDIEIGVEVFVPLNSWFISGSNLRPFAILGEVQKSLQNKQVNGVGKIKGGSFSLEFITEESVTYIMRFTITNYD